MKKGPKAKAGGKKTPKAPKAPKAPAPPKSPKTPPPAPAGKKRGEKCPHCGACPADGDIIVGTRMQLDRMFQIHEAVRKGDYPSQTRLAEELGYGRKAIHDDVNFMIDRLGMPLAYDEVRHGWGYTQPFVEFPLLYITEDELIALCVATRALAAFAGTPFAAVLLRILEKLRYSLRDRIKFSLEEVEGALSFGPAGTKPVDPGTFELVSVAALKGHEIACEYENIYGVKSSKVLHPVHVTARRGQWYMLVQDLTKPAPFATYKLSRTDSVRRTGQAFEKLPRESWEAHLASTTGIYCGGTPEPVRLLLTPIGAKLVAEQPLHLSQELTLNEDGSGEALLNAPITPEFRADLLTLSPEVLVIEPLSLRLSIGEVGQRLADWARQAVPNGVAVDGQAAA